MSFVAPLLEEVRVKPDLGMSVVWSRVFLAPPSGLKIPQQNIHLQTHLNISSKSLSPPSPSKRMSSPRIFWRWPDLPRHHLGSLPRPLVGENPETEKRRNMLTFGWFGSSINENSPSTMGVEPTICVRGPTASLYEVSWSEVSQSPRSSWKYGK